ncbi:decapping enzyme [Sporothrix brasiliensis 5110]|uniref:Decapping enzyme n=1 Tax=Sporothrix brasiliensis 5110 TaxID=1398154 RepID=A0A0C2EZP6_9PEZI|nr:decapping enzyme [Sporothrix brasiliensis 5110]KIH92014.1 decapping enzyme [Sporothrix brasiliensis 5110]
MPRKAHKRQKSQPHGPQQPQHHVVQQLQPHQQQQQNNHTSDGPPVDNQHPADVHIPTESIDEMNLRVLQCYEPTIRSIEAVAASSVVYAINGEAGGWIKADPQIEGTLFLCEQEPLQIEEFVLPRACVFVLNRKGLMNVVVDLARVCKAEVLGDLITLGIENEETASKGPDGTNGASGQQVLGLWIHGNGTTGSGSGMSGPLFDPDMVVRRWQAVQVAMVNTLGSSQLLDTMGFLDTAATMAKVKLTGLGLNPDGIATTAVGPQPNVKELMAMVLGQTSGRGLGQEGS